MYHASCSVTSLVLSNFCALQSFIPNHTLISNLTCCAIYWCHLLNKANLCTIFLSMFISFLSTFRVTVCPSSGETTASMRHLVFDTLYGWLSGMHTRHVEKRNKFSKKNCAPSWFYLQDYTGMHSQQNIKELKFLYVSFLFNKFVVTALAYFDIQVTVHREKFI